MPASPQSNTPPLVSVIMLSIDRPQYIDSAIQSVQRQDYSHWELIIVHDGGDPRVNAAVMLWLTREPRVRYYPRPQIGNIANAMNHGLRQCQGTLIAVLDDDDAWTEPTKLSRQVARFQTEVRLLALGGGAVVVDSAGRESLRYRRPGDPRACARMALVANPLIHSTVMFRRDAADSVALYDESLPGYQDWDLWLKLMRIGEVSNLDECVATYRVWDGGGTSRKVLGNAWSAVRIVFRHGPHFPRRATATALSLGYLLFALLPPFVRRPLYQTIAKWKKRHFSPETLTS